MARTVTSSGATAWRRWGVYGLLLLAVVAWGASFVAARTLLDPGPSGQAVVSPTLLAAVRFAIASIVFIPILLHSQRGPRRIRRSDVPLFLLLGQLAISLYFWLQYTGLQLTNSGLAAVLVVGLIPLATMVVSGVALGEPLGTRRAAALALGAAGVFVVVSQRGLAVALETGFLFGAFCLVANAVCFALYSTLVRGLRTRYSSLSITAAMTVSGTLGLLLLTTAGEDWGALGALSTQQWAAIAYLALGCSVLAYFFYNFALSRLEASKAAAWVYLEPPVAIVLGVALLGESVAIQTVAGGLVILASLYLTERA